MILLDTNALIWALAGHARAEPLLETGARLYISPASLLELQFLGEVGKIRVVPNRSISDVCDDPRWELDNPTAEQMFRKAMTVSWTRDPFDRLLVGHALARRFRFATGDRKVLEHLEGRHQVAL